MIEIICKIILCHLFGDYVLQCDYIAKSKGDNWYHLFVHCGLYTLPFCFCFGYNIGALVIFISHLIVDSLKARYKKINYVTDQIIHYIIAFLTIMIVTQ